MGKWKYTHVEEYEPMMLDASQGYTSLSVLSEDMTGTVQFIIRRDPAEEP